MNQVEEHLKSGYLTDDAVMKYVFALTSINRKLTLDLLFAEITSSN